MKCLRNGLWPCGKCAACLHNKVEDWKFRLAEEMDSSASAYFLTLTYDDEFVPYYGVSLTHVQSFFKMMRKEGWKFKYFGISEYGPTTHRPHYHILLFFEDQVDYDVLFNDIERVWKKGFISLSEMNRNRIQYVANYHVTKGFSPADKAVNFKVSSKGLGVAYLTENRQKFIREKSNGTTKHQGYRQRLPRYYREQLTLFDDEKDRISPPPSRDVIDIPKGWRRNLFSPQKFDILAYLDLEKKRAEWWNKRVLKKIFEKKNKI